jgi:hypothetical protein
MDGIEPSFEAYESPVLPLNYIGIFNFPMFNTNNYIGILFLNIAFYAQKSNYIAIFHKNDTIINSGVE